MKRPHQWVPVSIQNHSWYLTCQVNKKLQSEQLRIVIKLLYLSLFQFTHQGLPSSTLTLALIHPAMSSLQIPFSRWDWPNTEAASVNYDNSDGISSRGSEITSSGNKSPTILNSHSDHCNKSKTTNYNNHHHHHSHSHTHNHRSDIPLSPNCSHPKSNPIVASLSSLSAMLLEGQAVLAHQTTSAIWLFIGLNSGAIWKWTISLVRKNQFGFPVNIVRRPL